jgi:hypothetical protein
MATQAQSDTLDIEEQLARIAKMRREDEKMSAEIRKLLAEDRKLLAEARFLPVNSILALVGGLGGVIAATATLVKYFSH